MKAKDMIRQLIREELQTALQEQTKQWWSNPSQSEVDGHLYPSEVHEQGMGDKKRIRKGQRMGGGGKSRREGPRYVSAGTVSPTNTPPNKLSPGQVRNREAIGDKMLNAHARKSASATKFKQSLIKSLKKSGQPTDLMHQYSKIWARASGMAAKGLTASDWSVDNSKTAGKKNKKAAKKKAQAPQQTPPTP